MNNRQNDFKENSLLTENNPFQLVAFTPSGLPDPSLAIAATRAGGLGVLDLEYTTDLIAASNSIRKMIKYARSDCGIKLNGDDNAFLSGIAEKLPDKIVIVVITSCEREKLRGHISRFHELGKSVFVSVTSLAEAEMAEQSGADGVLAKGNEAAGLVGEKTSFILLQQIVAGVSLPVWVQGGIGLHTAAACYVAGASGVVLDSQLALTRESYLPEVVKKRVAHMDGTETICLGGHSIYCRVYNKPGLKIDERLIDIEKSAEDNSGISTSAKAAWHEYIKNHLTWDEDPSSLWLLGQDTALAANLAQQYRTVGGVVQALRQSIYEHVRIAKAENILGKGSPLAQSHGTIFPIVQGPMARVSDNAAFAAYVAKAGGLPFIALSKLSGKIINKLLTEVANVMGSMPWGIGILGFNEDRLFQAQVQAVDAHRPAFAIVAGGKPGQVALLESKGIRTYVHMQSGALLEMFIEQGARNFIFEGKECGGHIGPRSSFVLWDEMIRILLGILKSSQYIAKDFHVLFAGGIHDAVSAAMIVSMAAPLAEKGVRIGVVMGTAYLFTNEIVKTGAVVSTFQKNALNCAETHILETSPGHAIRCCKTPFVRYFEDEKTRMSHKKLPSGQLRSALEELIIGRLRVASKGITRKTSDVSTSGTQEIMSLSEEQQNKEGIYMVGQLAALRKKTCSIRELHHGVAEGSSGILRTMLPLETEDTAQLEQSSSDIAIVGIACLFPKAGDLHTYWENILNKVNAISEIPPDRWDWKLYFDQDKSAKDKIYSRWGGFLNAIPFDPLKYGIPPSSLKSIEPLHLMTLEVVSAALKDAGYEDREFNRLKTSVILGTGGGVGEVGQGYIVRSCLPSVMKDYPEQVMGALPEWTEDSFPGILENIIAGRVANRFNLGGTNYIVDAACASSLTAMYSAVKELETGSSDMVITGGVDAFQNPFTYFCFSKTQALSMTGQCRVFDEKANGTVISEGLGIMVLKRLADAERDGDRIYAVIKSIAASSDGRDRSMTAPSVEGQLLALRRAYKKAGFSPATVGLMEAHGTGTVLGDSTEAESVTKLLEEHNTLPGNCAIGSVKSMIGHTKGAAGTAGMIKAALSVYYHVLPPTMRIEMPNPAIRSDRSPLYVNTETRPWTIKEGIPRRASVNAFGFGGTNFHAVLEEYDSGFMDSERLAPLKTWPVELFLWSAETASALVSALSQVSTCIEQAPDIHLKDIAYSIYNEYKKGEQADGFRPFRLAVVSSSLSDLREKLLSAIQSLNTPGCEIIDESRGIHFRKTEKGTEGKVAFLFPGQGSQYPDMLREIAVIFPVVLRSFVRADTILKDKFPEKLSSYIFPPQRFSDEEKKEQKTRLTRTDIAQPSLGAASYGIFRLLRGLGISPDMTAGHSYGEYVALCAAGAFGEETLYRVSEARGRLIMEATQGNDLGTMSAVSAGVEAIGPIVNHIDGVVIANINSPEQTILSGTKESVVRAVKALTDNGFQSKSLQVSAGFHSPVVEPAKHMFAGYLEGVEFSAPAIDVFSNTYASPHSKNGHDIRACLAEHMVKPVRFVDEIEAMYESGARVFVEAGPGNVLSNLTRKILKGRSALVVQTDTKGAGALAGFLLAIGQMAVYGTAISLDMLFDGRSPLMIDLKSPGIGKKQELSRTVCFVNGRGVHQPKALQDTEVFDKVTTKKKEQMKSPSGPAKDPGETASAGNQELFQFPKGAGMSFLTPNGNERMDDVMKQYQKLMDRFLEMQERIMTAYLQGASDGEPLHKVIPLDRTAQVSDPTGEERLQQKTSVFQAVGEEILLPATAGDVDSAAIRQGLLRIACERTGYPEDMLDLDADIEADLGIDSIKRVEILGLFAKSLKKGDQEKIQGVIDEFSSLKTLRAVIDRTAEVVSTSGRKDEGNRSVTAYKKQVVLPSVPDESTDAETDIPRFLLEEVEQPLPSEMPEVTLSGTFVITDDGRGVSASLQKEIHNRGGNTVIVRHSTSSVQDGDKVYAADFGLPSSIENTVREIVAAHGQVNGLVHLLPLGHTVPLAEMDMKIWGESLDQEVKGFFYFAQALAPALRAGNGRLIAVTALGGEGADNEDSNAFPGQAGLAGIVKTAAQEWPKVQCRAVHADISNAPSVLSKQLIREITAADHIVEVRYTGRKRFADVAKLSLLNIKEEARLEIQSDWVILITGGAYGITAEIAHTLAGYRPTLILAGRFAYPDHDEAPETSALTAPQEIKEALIRKLGADGQALTPVRVEAAYARLMKDREMRKNMSKFRKAGAEVHYFQADVRDEKAFGGLIDQIYTSFGRIDGVIHGAGIIEDKLIEDKKPESFDRVFDTKTASAFILSRKLRRESLKFIVMFTSVAGIFGNRGQSDYAAANEVVNRLSACMDRQLPGRIVAVNWGPWKKAGMVSPEVERQFRERGVQMIPPAGGSRMLDEELRYGRKGDVSVIIGDGPWERINSFAGVSGNGSALPLISRDIHVRRQGRDNLEFVKNLDPEKDLYLRDHCLDGKPVLPAAVAVELMAEAAGRGWGDREIISLIDVSVLNGIVIDDGTKDIMITATENGNGVAVEGGLEINAAISEKKNPRRLSYRSKIILAYRRPAPVTYIYPDVFSMERFPMSINEAYNTWLFHGPRFQCIKQIEGISKKGMVAIVTPSDPGTLLRESSGGRWLIDPIVLDSGPQLAILWARYYRDITPLPSRFDAIHIFDAPGESSQLRCHLEIAEETAMETVHANVYYTDTHGKVRYIVEGLQATGSKSLNRLATPGGP